MRWPRPGFDLYLGTSKAFKWLAGYGDTGRPQVALPYQNILDTYLFHGRRDLPVGLERHVGFERELRETLPGCSMLTGLPFMDLMVEKQRSWIRRDLRYRVLLLHPGGYRNVITAPGEDKQRCLAAQRALYARILAALPPDAEMVLKIHPLAARYHDAEANAPLAEAMGFRIAEGWLGDVLFDCDVVLSLGSSSLFEIAGLGIAHWVLPFFSDTRTRYYSEFASMFLVDDAQLARVLADRCAPQWTSPTERAFMARLSQVCDGRAVERALQCIPGARDCASNHGGKRQTDAWGMRP